jgi:hypothetical protein
MTLRQFALLVFVSQLLLLFLGVVSLFRFGGMGNLSYLIEGSFRVMLQVPLALFFYFVWRRAKPGTPLTSSSATSPLSE